MDKEFEKAIQYVRENKTWSDAQEARALEIINKLRCSIAQADCHIYDEIHDLMEEYSDDNFLAEGWWYGYADEDDIFFAL